MMNPFKYGLSYVLLSIASGYQGRGNFQKVIDFSLKAKAISPTSTIVLKQCYLLICDDYRRIKAYDQAIITTQEALRQFPNEEFFYQLMVMALTEKGEKIEKVIPFIKNYLMIREKKNCKISTIMKRFLKLFQKDVDIEAYGKQIEKWDDEWSI